MAVKFTTLPIVTVVTPGTALQVSTDKIMVNALFVQAHEDNTGNIYVGDSNVSSTQGTSIGPGQPLQYNGVEGLSSLSELLISDVWVDAQSPGDRVRVAYFKRKSHNAFE